MKATMYHCTKCDAMMPLPNADDYSGKKNVECHTCRQPHHWLGEFGKSLILEPGFAPDPPTRILSALGISYVEVDKIPVCGECEVPAAVRHLCSVAPSKTPCTICKKFFCPKLRLRLELSGPGCFECPHCMDDHTLEGVGEHIILEAVGKAISNLYSPESTGAASVEMALKDQQPELWNRINDELITYRSNLERISQAMRQD